MTQLELPRLSGWLATTCNALQKSPCGLSENKRSSVICGVTSASSIFRWRCSTLRIKAAVTPKCWQLSTRLPVIISQKTVIFIATTTRTTNLQLQNYIYNGLWCTEIYTEYFRLPNAFYVVSTVHHIVMCR